ncbi:MAG: DUF1127 domain-containing protein [Antarcticimicrobium sp.]|uniref:DUF1127 domain-containing protein n=1 Tax=Antarcticimicrobium sp. TaxID=2824147 RepID=UPI0026086E3F|nr:DUF1127 domain-containing protein [Antarcticimicrobium sp.]MDF1717525.1 DUF1127 domain-containing protein [Antarcticimicrobium sp.]
MTFTTASHRCTTRRPSLLAALGHLVGVWRQRQALRSLDDRALRDIGVSRDAARAEARRPIWDAPETWRR